MSPPVELFLTTIVSSPALRQRQGNAAHDASTPTADDAYDPILRQLVMAPPRSPHPLLSGSDDDGLEYILRVLQVKKIPFTSYDLASDEDAKKLWRRKAPLREYLGATLT